VLRGFFPRRSRVVRTEQSAFLVLHLHNQVHALPMVSRRNRNSRSPPVFFWKSVPRDLLPGDALIQRLIKPATGTIGCSFLPWLSNPVPQRCVNYARILGLKTEIHRCRNIVFVQPSLPGPPAVRRAENSALFVRPGTVAHRRNQDDIRIARIA